jgi:hypothetical protein
VYHSDTRNPGDISRRPDDGIIDSEPEILPIQPVRPDELTYRRIAASPFAGVSPKKQDIVVLREETIHERLQLFGVSLYISLLKIPQRS